MSDEVVFTGGSLGFLSKKKKTSKKKKKRKPDAEEADMDSGSKKKSKVAFSDGVPSTHDSSPPPPASANSDSEDELTPFERSHLSKKRSKESRDTAALAEKSHRERVDAFNQGLSTLTEHNDLPRISAAGNG